MNRTGVTVLIVLLVVLVTLSSPVFAEGKQEETGELPDKIKIGAAVSLSGDLSRLGQMVKRGYDLWQEKVNEEGGIEVGDTRIPVEIIYYDDQSSNQTAAKLTEKLITQDNVHFLLGPYGSGPTFATTAIAEKYNIITIATLANASKIYDRGYKNVFSVLSPGGWIFHSFIDMLVNQTNPPEKYAIITPSDLFPITVAKGARDYVEEKGYEVSYYEEYSKGAKDLSSTMLKIKNSEANVLMGSGYLQEAILTVRQIDEQNVDLQAMGFTTGPELEDFNDNLGSDADGVFGVSWWMPQMAYSGSIFGSASDYAELYNSKYEERLTYQAAAASQGGVLLQLAIEEADSLKTEEVRRTLKNYEGITFWGPTEFDDRGMNIAGGTVAFQLQDGEKVTVWPEDAATGEPQFPVNYLD
jgi:branched-chain amino acid transport system substrate-binding protein